MGINFAGGNLTELAANKLASSGRVIQTVEVTNGGNFGFGSGAGGDLYVQVSSQVLLQIQCWHICSCITELIRVKGRGLLDLIS